MLIEKVLKEFAARSGDEGICDESMVLILLQEASDVASELLRHRKLPFMALSR